VLTISCIVRSQPLVVYLHGLQEQHQPNYQEVMAEVERLGYQSSFYKECQPEEVKSERVFMKGDDLRAVMMVDKKPKEFYTLALKYT
jgi:predicted alpha/beta-fold hydrolase